GAARLLRGHPRHLAVAQPGPHQGFLGRAILRADAGWADWGVDYGRYRHQQRLAAIPPRHLPFPNWLPRLPHRHRQPEPAAGTRRLLHADGLAGNTRPARPRLPLFTPRSVAPPA